MNSALLSQYKASLQTLRVIIEQCPDKLWSDMTFINRTWHICYHVLFYTNLYLSDNEEDALIWPKAKLHYQFLSRTDWAPEYDPIETVPYTRNELLEFCNFVEEQLNTTFTKDDFSHSSGFSWLPFSRFELYLYTLRHLQHHIGQLIERVSARYGSSIPWIGRGK